MGAEPQGRGRPFLARRLGTEPEFRERVETADRLGIPPSQLDGREPAEVTKHEYDDGGRLVRSVTTREPRWTEQDRAEMLALAAYRTTLCPNCGGPLEVCTAPEKTGERFRATRIRCQRSSALAIAKAAVEENKVPHPEALVWFTEPTGR